MPTEPQRIERYPGPGHLDIGGVPTKEDDATAICRPREAEDPRRQLRENPPDDLYHTARLLNQKGFCSDSDHSFTRVHFNYCADIIRELLRERGCELDLAFMIPAPNWAQVIYDKRRFPRPDDITRAVQAAEVMDEL